MADQQKKISSIVPRRGSKKKVAAMIRQESFKDAYPENEAKQSAIDENNSPHAASQQVNPNDVPRNLAENHSTEESSDKVNNHTRVEQATATPTEPTNNPDRGAGSTSRRNKKGKNKYAYDYTTIGVDSTTALAVQIASKMLQEKQNEFTKKAIRNYLKDLIKKGKLYDLPQFDI